MRTITLALHIAQLLLLLMLLAAICGGITGIYWRADGPADAAGIFLLILGNALVWGGWLWRR